MKKSKKIRKKNPKKKMPGSKSDKGGKGGKTISGKKAPQSFISNNYNFQ